jgi:hypothetical protein
MTRRADLIAAVGVIQNHPMYQHQDILTFCGFLTDDEIAAHIERNMAGIARWSETVHRRKRK